MIDHPPLIPYLEHYSDLTNHHPCRVVLTLKQGARLAGYDPLNLDNLLARVVVDEATHGEGLETRNESYRLPVPLICLWRSDDELPLWAATPFQPVGEAVKDICYWHKRVQTGRWTGTKSGSYSIRSTNGRYMERRVPLPTQLCETWTADCIGDPTEIARLLSCITFVSKRRTMGNGEVQEWRVEPLALFELVRDGRLTRPIPAMAVSLLDGYIPDGNPAPVGWTPPQWMPRLFRPGWWAGTPCVRLMDGAATAV